MRCVYLYNNRLIIAKGNDKYYLMTVQSLKAFRNKIANIEC